MLIRGNIDKTLSTFPLLSVFVLSVTKALNAASLAVLPKKVITQSITIIIVPLSNAELATKVILLFGSKKANKIMEIPHKI